MKLSLPVSAFLLILTTLTVDVSGQKPVCSCKSPDNTCDGSITCPTGCTAVCGSKDRCYLSCRSEFLTDYITVKFLEKKGHEIASLLTDRVKKKIEFTPHHLKRDVPFNLEIKNDNIWNVLNSLSKRGTVKLGGMNFENLKRLRKESRKGGKLTVSFVEIPAHEAVAILAFLTGRPFQLKSGDPNRLVSVSLQRVTLNQAVDKLSASAGIQIEMKK